MSDSSKSRLRPDAWFAISVACPEDSGVWRVLWRTDELRREEVWDMRRRERVTKKAITMATRSVSWRILSKERRRGRGRKFKRADSAGF